MYGYAVQQAWRHLTDDLASKQALVQVAMWTIGEYADLLDETSIDLSNKSGDQLPPTEDEVISMCETVVNSSLMNLVTKEYAISALIKLSARYPNSAPRMKKTIDGFGCHMNVELQQRSVEFSSIFTKHNNLRVSLLDKMPPMKSSSIRRENVQNGQPSQDESNNVTNLTTLVDNKPANQASSAALLDLLSEVEPPTTTSLPSNQPQKTSNAIDDLLGLIRSEPSNGLFPAQSITPTIDSSTQDLLSKLSMPVEVIIYKPSKKFFI